MIRRLWTISLTLLLVASLLAACGGKSAQSNGDGDKSASPGTSTSPATSPTATEKTLDITWLGPPLNASGQNDSYPQKALESRFNLKITPIFLGSDYNQKKPVILSGGQIPDFIWEPDPINVQNDAEQGFLEEIPYEMIKQYAPSLFKLVNDYAPAAWMYSQVNGKNYGIPTVYPGGTYSYPGTWRMDLLKSVGITKVPETLTEMHDVFAKLVQAKKVKYGMTTGMKYWWTAFPDLFGAYDVLPFNWMTVDGKIVWGGTQPATKQALQLLHDWYKEGLIDPEFVTDDPGGGKSVDIKFQNGATAYETSITNYANFDESNPASFISTIKKLIPTAEIAPGVLPAGPDGKRGIFRWGAAGNILAFGKQVADDKEKLIRLLKLFDTQLNDEKVYNDTKAGQQGVMWDFKDPALGPSGGTKPIPPYDDPNVQQKNVVSANLGQVAQTFFNPQISPDLNDKYTPKNIMDFTKKYNSSQYVMTDAFLKPDVVPSAKKYMTDLTNMELTAFSQIIRGDKPIDYFDEFVKQWKSQGGDQLIEEANDLNNKRNQVYQQVGVKTK